MISPGRGMPWRLIWEALPKRCSLCLKVSPFIRRTIEIFPPCCGRLITFPFRAEFCQNFEEETGRIETGLDPINSPIKDEAAMNMLRLESRLASVLDYIARLKVAQSWIDKELCPEIVLQNDLESLMTRLNEVPDRVQAWKKSAARCGA